MSGNRSRPGYSWGFFRNRMRPYYVILGIKIPLPSDLGIQATNKISEDLTDAINNYAATRLASQEATTGAPSEEWLKTAAKCATHAWRAERRIVDPDTGEPRDDTKLLHRDIAIIRKAMEQLGIETIDPVGKVYDPGMALRVVSFEPTAGFAREEIKETIKPTLLWHGKLLQVGEVIVGTPQTVKSEEKNTP